MRHRHLRNALIVLLAGTAAGFALSLLCRAPGLPGEPWRMELATYDWRLRERARVRDQSSDIVIVGIDTNSLLAEGRWPWPRSKHAQVIETLSAAGAKTILLDILFDLPGDPAEDRALVDAVRRSGRVVLTAEMIEETVMDGLGGLMMPVTRTFRPFPELEAAGVATGMSMLPRDTDGTVRRVRLGWDAPTPEAPPELFTGLVAAALGEAADPQRYYDAFHGSGFVTHPWVTDADLLIDYRAPPPTGFRYVSCASVLRDEVPPEVFRDKIVLLGMVSGLNPDLKLHPLGAPRDPPEGEAGREEYWERSEMPGVECIAHVTDMLRERRLINPSPLGAAALFPIIYAALVSLCVLLLRFWGGVIATVILALMHWFMAFHGIITYGVWLPVVSVGLGAAGAYVMASGLLWVLDERAARLLRRTWERRVSPEILEQILSHPELLHVPGRRVDATVVFMDLAGFTNLSTRMDAEQLITYINQYMTLATEVTRKHGGVVHKFIGDGIMMVYGDPVDIGNHAQRAVDAAYEFQGRMAQLRERVEAEGGPPLSARVGIHSGEVIVGDIGPEALLEYTVMGKSVNLASRLEGLNKQLGSAICLSEDTHNRLEDRYDLVAAGRHEVAGYPDPVVVHVDGAAETAGDKAAGGSHS